MMRFISLLLIFMMPFTVSLAKKQRKVIYLNEYNTVYFNTDVNERSVNAAIDKFIEIDNKLLEGQPIYFVLNTPGGSVIAGMRLINFIENLERPVHTISKYSASMGFIFVQALGDRYVIDSSILMTHSGSVRCQGKEDDIRDCLNILIAINEEMAKLSAKRIGRDWKEWAKFVHIDREWYGGHNLVKLNLADEVVTVRCSKSLLKKVVRSNVSISCPFTR